jgi:ribitol-5-phosphate 2-dehydrogenase (NADP+) / D-ribitol-5-phosphate cytidylyltransferase
VTDPHQLRTVAVVLAGGTGSRLGSPTPKQLLPVAGRPVLEHTVAAFEAAEAVDEILVLMAAEWVPAASEVVERARFGKVSRVLAGGDTRSASSMLALDAVGPDECNVLLHDAVRPLVDARIIRGCVEALRLHRAVVVAVPSTDTIIEVHDERVRAIPDRDTMRRVQTPQGFRASIIRRAYALAMEDPAFAATDDCSVVLRYLPEEPICVVEGSQRNIKVTHPLDLVVAEQLLRGEPGAGQPL